MTATTATRQWRSDLPDVEIGGTTLPALVLGVMFDPRGPAVPAALLALFLAVVPMAPLLFLVTRDW